MTTPKSCSQPTLHSSPLLYTQKHFSISVIGSKSDRISDPDPDLIESSITMLTCIACSKHLSTAGAPDPDDDAADTPNTRQALRSLTSQIKDMVLKASGAYRHCSKPCTGSNSKNHHHHPRFGDSDSVVSVSDRFQYAYKRAGESLNSTPRLGFSSGDGTPSSAIEEEEEVKEWVAQVEPGVLITFVSVPEGGNDLKRIRFSREMFNKWQAQRWWAENYDKVMELYNVQKFNSGAVPLPTPPRSEDESSKMESAEGSPVTATLSKERLPHNFQRALTGKIGQQLSDSGCLASTPKLSSMSGAKTETSSVDAASMRTSSELDRSGELSVSAVSNASDQETEWVEQDEPGVYITIRALPGGIRELRRVRFSRERFGEMHARLWWEENRARIHEQYL